MRIRAVVAAAAMIIVSAEAEPQVLSPDKSIPLRIDAEHTDVRQCKSLTVRYDDVKTIRQLRMRAIRTGS
jgi:hypothetical protein